MVNKVFGEVFFDTGWYTKTEITLWGKVYFIYVCAASYRKTDLITTEQEEAYATFKGTISEKQKRIELLLSSEENLKWYKVAYGLELEPEQLPEELTPTGLLISREGECALLFDQESDPDNGLAVVIISREEVLTQDDYL